MTRPKHNPNSCKDCLRSEWRSVQAEIEVSHVAKSSVPPIHIPVERDGVVP